MITKSGFGVNTKTGPKSYCILFYQFNINKKSSKVIASYPFSYRHVNCDQRKGVSPLVIKHRDTLFIVS